MRTYLPVSASPRPAAPPHLPGPPPPPQKPLQKPDRTLIISKGTFAPTWGPSPRPLAGRRSRQRVPGPGSGCSAPGPADTPLDFRTDSRPGVPPRPGLLLGRLKMSLPPPFQFLRPEGRFPSSLQRPESWPEFSLEPLGLCHLLRALLLLLLRGFSILPSPLSSLVVHSLHWQLPLRLLQS